MEVEWRDRSDSCDLFDGRKFQGVLSYVQSPIYWWYNSPHAVTKFTSSTLDEAKQIAQAIWALQESVGVK